MPKIKVDGLKELEKALKDNVTMDDVKKVVRQNGSELQEKVQNKADFKKGYATGTTKRSIGLEIQDGGFTAEVEPKTEYSPYLEYGTRFMEAQPFVKPAYEEQKEQFKRDMQKLVKQVVYIDPQQEIFTAVQLGIKDKGHSVYDTFLPPEGTPYPFVYMGECQQIDEENKTAIFGKVYQTIHIWHNNPKQRGTVSQMLLDIKTACRNIKSTKNFSWSCKITNQRIFADNTTETPLLHGVVEVEFQFS